MKTKLIFIIGLLTMFNSLYAQEDVQRNYEVGGLFFNFSGMSVPSDPLGSGSINKMFFANGLFVKRHLKDFSLRFAYENYSGKISVNGKQEYEKDTLNTLGIYGKNFFSVGIEKSFVNKKIFQVFGGGDLNLYTGKYQGLSTSLSDNTSFSTMKNEQGFGINLFLGMRVTFINRIRLTFECSANGIISKENENTSFSKPNHVNTQSQATNFSFNRHYTKLGLSFLF
ncbi:MAG: hypothetical protein LC115_05440 [Bacteroidia bacterium]|nr:hypothetical protein [Bacteroidia bacterium]WKZ76273.1 MAG: hypothetical protein QY303_05110 [Vicingaceae bacterium]